MFSKPLDPSLKAKIYENLRSDPEIGVQRLREAYLRDIELGKFETIKEVIRVLKFMIKDKIPAKPKFFALLLIKELMRTEKKPIVEYFIKKLLSRFFLIAQFEQKNPDIKRGERCLKKYYDSNDPANLEFANKFFILLLECWKHWSQMFGADYKRIREKCEKVRSLFPTNDMFYDQLETQMVSVSGITGDRGFRPQYDFTNSEYQIQNSLDQESNRSRELPEDNRTRLSNFRAAQVPQRQNESTERAKKMIIGLVRKGQAAFDSEYDRAMQTLRSELTNYTKLIQSITADSTDNIQVKLGLSREIEMLNEYKDAMESYKGKMITFETLKKNLTGETSGIDRDFSNDFNTNGTSNFNTNDNRSGKGARNFMSVEVPKDIQAIKTRSERHAKKAVENSNPPRHSLGKSNKTKESLIAIEEFEEGENMNHKSPVQEPNDSEFSKKEGPFWNTFAKTNPRRRLSDNVRMVPLENQRENTKSHYSDEEGVNEENIFEWKGNDAHPQSSRPMKNERIDFDAFKEPQGRVDPGIGAQEHLQTQKPSNSNIDAGLKGKKNALFASTFHENPDDEVEETEFDDYISKNFGNNKVFDGLEKHAEMDTIQEESKEDYEESRRSFSRYADNINASRKLVRSNVDTKKSIKGDYQLPIKFDDFHDFENAESYSRSNSTRLKKVTQSDPMITSGRNKKKSPQSSHFEKINPSASAPLDLELIDEKSQNTDPLQSNTNSGRALIKGDGTRKNNFAQSDQDFNSKRQIDDSFDHKPVIQSAHVQNNQDTKNSHKFEQAHQKFEQRKKGFFTKNKNLKITPIDEQLQAKSLNEGISVDDPFNFRTPQEPKAPFFAGNIEVKAKSQAITPQNNYQSSNQQRDAFFKSENVFSNFFDNSSQPLSKFDPFAAEIKPDQRLPSPQNIGQFKSKTQSRISDRSIENEHAMAFQPSVAESVPNELKKLKNLSMSSIENTQKTKLNMIQSEFNAKLPDIFSEQHIYPPRVLTNDFMPDIKLPMIDLDEYGRESRGMESIKESNAQMNRRHSEGGGRYLLDTFAKVRSPKRLSSEMNIPQESIRSGDEDANTEFQRRMDDHSPRSKEFVKKPTATFDKERLEPTPSEQYDSNKLVKPDFNNSRLDNEEQVLKVIERKVPESSESNKLGSLKFRDAIRSNDNIVVKVKKVVVNQNQSLNSKLDAKDHFEREHLEKEFVELKVHNEFLRQQCELLMLQLSEKDQQVTRLKSNRLSGEDEAMIKPGLSMVDTIEAKIVQRRNELLQRENNMLLKINKELVTSKKHNNLKKLEENNLYKQLNKELQFYTEELKRELDMEKSRNNSHISQAMQTKLSNVNKDIEKIREMHRSLKLEIKDQSQNLTKQSSLKPTTILQDLSETTSQLIATRNTNNLDQRQRLSRNSTNNKTELARLSPVQSIDENVIENVKASGKLKVSYLEDTDAPVRVDPMKSSFVLYKNISAMAVMNPMASQPSNMHSDRSAFDSKQHNRIRTLPSTSNTLMSTDRSLSIYKLFYDEVESKRQTRTTSHNSHLFSNPSMVVSSRLTSKRPLQMPTRTSIDRNALPKNKIPKLPILPSMALFGSSNSLNPSLELKNPALAPSTPDGKVSYLPTNRYIDLTNYPLYLQENNLFLLKACSLFNKSMIFENDELRVFCQTKQQTTSQSTEISIILTYSGKVPGLLLSSSIGSNPNFKVFPKAYVQKSLTADLRQTVTYVVPREPTIIDFPGLILRTRLHTKSSQITIPLPFSINKFARQITPTKDFVIRYLDQVN